MNTQLRIVALELLVVVIAMKKSITRTRLTRYLLLLGHCIRCFPCIISLNSPNHLGRDITIVNLVLIGKENKNERGQVTFQKSQLLSGRGMTQTQPCMDTGSISPKTYAPPLTIWVLWVRLIFLALVSSYLRVGKSLDEASSM